MQTSQPLRIYDVLSIRSPSQSQPRAGSPEASQRTQARDLVHDYFVWLTSGPVGPREQAWAKHARGRLA